MCLSGVSMLRGAAVSLIALSPSLSLLFLVVIDCAVFLFFFFPLYFFILSQPNTPFSLPLFLLPLELQQTEVDDSGSTFHR